MPERIGTSEEEGFVNQKRDYYEVLGVSRGATDQEVKSAYRRLALQHHPDRNPDNKEAAEERFKEITEAYSVLADSDKRAAYDRFGFAGVGGGGAAAPDFSSTIFSGLRVCELPVRYSRRMHGRSKVSGSVCGSFRAGARILWTILLCCLLPIRHS